MSRRRGDDLCRDLDLLLDLRLRSVLIFLLFLSGEDVLLFLLLSSSLLSFPSSLDLISKMKLCLESVYIHFIDSITIHALSILNNMQP